MRKGKDQRVFGKKPCLGLNSKSWDGELMKGKKRGEKKDPRGAKESVCVWVERSLN